MPIPYAYSEQLYVLPDMDGMSARRYTNHVTQTSSWLHPAKLKVLQDAGFVPVAPDLPDFVADDVPVPAPWERKRKEEDGSIEYENRETKEVEKLHPEALHLARRNGSRETATITLVPRDDEAMGKEADEYLSKWELPPWIVQEDMVPPAGACVEPKPYWIDYRTDTLSVSRNQRFDVRARELNSRDIARRKRVLVKAPKTKL